MSIFNALLSYKERFENRLKNEICSWGKKTPLRDACEYALLNGGKRFRPTIITILAENLGHSLDVFAAAKAVEFFHCASLIADDLPCMDNETERRNKPTTHTVYGEDVALLASYSLISAGYEALYEGREALKKTPFADSADERVLVALQSATYNTGILGIQTGQYLDLHPTEKNLALLMEVFEKKTVTLFEVAFVFGWIFGGGDLSKLPLVKQLAYSFGMAFQIADDFDDFEEDQKKGHTMNFINLLGAQEAFAAFQKEVEKFGQTLISLELESPQFQGMIQFLLQETEPKARKILAQYSPKDQKCC